MHYTNVKYAHGVSEFSLGRNHASGGPVRTLKMEVVVSFRHVRKEKSGAPFGLEIEARAAFAFAA